MCQNAGGEVAVEKSKCGGALAEIPDYPATIFLWLV
jgi:hypothetical protein